MYRHQGAQATKANYLDVKSMYIRCLAQKKKEKGETVQPRTGN